MRLYANQTETGPRSIALGLKSQDPEATSGLQKDRKITEQQKKTGNGPDVLDQTQMSKAEQRKVNWGILKTLVKYIWPKVRNIL